jgi:hypothetical protein
MLLKTLSPHKTNNRPTSDRLLSTKERLEKADFSVRGTYSDGFFSVECDEKSGQFSESRFIAVFGISVE